MRRAEAARARSDTRDWAVERRARTRHLIELGGLVQKAGLVDLTNDDRATLYGALLELAYQLRGDQGSHVAELWRRRGRRAFEADAAKP
jgi:hypothetical protein